MNAYALVIPIDDVLVGEVYTKLPLHCTLVHWFRTSMLRDTLVRAIVSPAVDAERMTLVSAAPAFFGPKNDIPVHVLAQNTPLARLHNILLRCITGNDAHVSFEDLRWVGEGYRPHVTTQGDRSFSVGSECHARSMCCVEALDEKNLAHNKVLFELALK